MSWSEPSEIAPAVGLFLQLDGAPPVASLYEQTIDLIVAAEQLGYHSARVTQHHFGERYGWLPSPLPFLAAVGQHARQIRLGTVVITIPLENPVRLVEDAAVTDLLINHRLELGLGSGLNQEVFATLGISYETRREDTNAGLAKVQRALRGEVLHENGSVLQPPAPGLADRLWLAVSRAENAAFAAQQGLGLLLGRLEAGGYSPLANQTISAQNYRAALASTGTGATPRIAVGRTVYPAKDRATAERDLGEAIEPLIASYIKSGFVPADASLEEVLKRQHIIYGHPEEIVATLQAEQAALGWTELLVQIDPGNLSHQKALRALELVAQEVQPHLASSKPSPVLAG